jgi:hypothetical protein
MLTLGLNQSPIELILATLSSGAKLPGYEADNSPPSSTEVKDKWSYTSILSYALMAWCLSTETI